MKRDGSLFVFFPGDLTPSIRPHYFSPAFFHNGAFTSLESALRFYLNTAEEARRYTPARLDADLMGPPGPMEPALARLDPLLARPVRLNEIEFRQLLAFLHEGLLDERARPERLRRLIPRTVPSGRPVARFE
jgi:cytochrome c peroxidase